MLNDKLALRKDIRVVRKQLKIELKELDILIKNIRNTSDTGLYNGLSMHRDNCIIIGDNFGKIVKGRFVPNKKE